MLNMTHQNQEVIRYFESLGYKVGWDCRYKKGEYWHEIKKDGKLIAQIDFDVPLNDIIEDFTCIHEGRDPTSNPKYIINGYGEEFNELMRKVAEND
jgi:hypothetical protein